MGSCPARTRRRKTSSGTAGPRLTSLSLSSLSSLCQCFSLSIRVNLDLRVENSAMKEELEEKTQLLRTAYEALEQQEQEMLRERSEYESRIESLRQSVLESQVFLCKMLF